jgi:hypothetical protein
MVIVLASWQSISCIIFKYRPYLNAHEIFSVISKRKHQSVLNRHSKRLNLIARLVQVKEVVIVAFGYSAISTEKMKMFLSQEIGKIAEAHA